MFWCIRNELQKMKRKTKPNAPQSSHCMIIFQRVPAPRPRLVTVAAVTSREAAPRHQRVLASSRRLCRSLFLILSSTVLHSIPMWPLGASSASHFSNQSHWMVKHCSDQTWRSLALLSVWQILLLFWGGIIYQFIFYPIRLPFIFSRL